RIWHHRFVKWKHGGHGAVICRRRRVSVSQGETGNRVEMTEGLANVVVIVAPGTRDRRQAVLEKQFGVHLDQLAAPLLLANVALVDGALELRRARLGLA